MTSYFVVSFPVLSAAQSDYPDNMSRTQSITEQVDASGE